jgi:glycosyltransferase involved in cell wall biosynthesis
MTEITEEYPLISCIMLAGRTALVDILRCITCFQSQTYPRKELIIVNNTKTQHEAAKLELPAQNDIFVIDSPTELTAGQARNYGISAANGQILAQFDADYWHSPNRLSAQVGTMANEKAHICVLARTLLYIFVSGRARIHHNQQNVILGTMVCTRPAKIEYPNVTHGEEYGLLHKMLQQGFSPIAINKPELCCKLLLTDQPRETKPFTSYCMYNVDLTDEQFNIVQNISKD